jgi:hypothetical protein
MLNKIWANTDRNQRIFLLYFPFGDQEERRTKNTRLQTYYLKRKEREKEQRAPKQLLAMEPARRCQHRIRNYPHSNQEREE